MLLEPSGVYYIFIVPYVSSCIVVRCSEFYFNLFNLSDLIGYTTIRSLTKEQ